MVGCRIYLTQILRLDVSIHTLCALGGLKQNTHSAMEIFFIRSVKNLHLAASKSDKISVPQRLRDEGF